MHHCCRNTGRGADKLVHNKRRKPYRRNHHVHGQGHGHRGHTAAAGNRNRENETAGELHDRLAALGADLLLETLEGLQRNEVERKAQDHSAATYAPQLDRETGRVDWNSDAKSIYNLIRGTNPWPGCYTVYKGERMKLWEAKVLEQKSRGTAGKVLEAGHGGMLVQAGSGTLLVTKIQMPSSRVMTVDEYLRGNSLETGYILGE